MTEAEAAKAAFQINLKDNVATVLEEIPKGTEVQLFGDHTEGTIQAQEEIPTGHKIALCDIAPGEGIFKYGVRIGRATKEIRKGSWVHLYVMESIYDQRSSHLDIKTGAPRDTKYE